MKRSSPPTPIATFPTFAPVDAASLAAIRPFLTEVQYIADFNLTEIWCWNRGRLDGGVSVLNGNPVIRWPAFPAHDDTATPRDEECGYLSFLPRHDPADTARQLVAYTSATTDLIQPSLRAVPVLDESTPIQDASAFLVTEDRDNFDYMISVKAWAWMEGGAFRTRRNIVHKLERTPGLAWRFLDLNDMRIRDAVLQRFRRWVEQRNLRWNDVEHEYAAITNLFDLAPAPRLFVPGAFIGDVLVGFSINEVVDDTYALGHFAKADLEIPGLTLGLLRQTCRYLAAIGVAYLNIEADLGDPGLRAAKTLLKPAFFLRKVMISPLT